MPRTPLAAQVSTTGATTRTPQKSLSDQVRKTRPNSSAGMTSPRRSEVGPNAALTSATAAAHSTSASTSRVRSMRPHFMPTPPQQDDAGDQRERVADRLAGDRAERLREVGEQEVADHDAGPEPDAVQEQDGEAEPGGRPEGRDGAVQVGELEPEPAGEVVGRGHQSDRAEVHDDGAAIAAKQPRARPDPLAGRARRPLHLRDSRLESHRRSYPFSAGVSPERPEPWSGWRSSGPSSPR